MSSQLNQIMNLSVVLVGLLVFYTSSADEAVNPNQTKWISDDITKCAKKYGTNEIRGWKPSDQSVIVSCFNDFMTKPQLFTENNDVSAYILVCAYLNMGLLEDNCVLRQRIVEQYLKTNDYILKRSTVESEVNRCFTENQAHNMILYKEFIGCIHVKNMI